MQCTKYYNRCHTVNWIRAHVVQTVRFALLLCDSCRRTTDRCRRWWFRMVFCSWTSSQNRQWTMPTMLKTTMQFAIIRCHCETFFDNCVQRCVDSNQLIIAFYDVYNFYRLRRTHGENWIAFYSNWSQLLSLAYFLSTLSTVPLPRFR